MEAAARNAPALLVLVIVALLVGIALVRTRRPSPNQRAAQPWRALLPTGMPIVDGLRISSSFAAGTLPVTAGGDFYDAFSLDDGGLAIAIGEADGEGMTAAMTMNVVRQALRSALIDGRPPADALRHANRVLLRSDAPGIVTAIAGVLDPATLQFRYASAGHAAPLLATADGQCNALPGEGASIALGVVPHHVTAEHTAAIPVDALLVLYTDGFTLSAGDADEGMASFRAALVETRTLQPDKPAFAIDRAMFGDGERADDATLLVIVPEPTLAHVDLRLNAEPMSAAMARTALRRFLAATPLNERRAFDALVAAGEAVANAIEHAYEGRPNQAFFLRARYDDETCTIFVEDNGRWHESSPEFRGRGIGMMRDLSDLCEIDRGVAGTHVMLTFRFTEAIADMALTAG